MSYTRFEPLAGNLHSNLLGMHLSTIDNSTFCEMFFRGESSPYDNQYGTPLIYVVPVTGENENTGDFNNQDGNSTVINLLMQLKAVQDESNNMFQNNNLVKNNIIKQIKAQGNNINLSNFKNQINQISKVVNNKNIDKREFNKAVDVAINTIKKKFN